MSLSCAQNGFNREIGSRLLPRSLYETGYEKIADTIIAFNSTFTLNQVGGGAVSSLDPDSVGVNPAWRNALAVGICGGGWKEGMAVVEIKAQKQRAKDCFSLLEDLHPGGETYLDELSLPFHHRSSSTNKYRIFFGNHYSRLLGIKDRYDPRGRFIVVEGVSSERWDDTLTCLK
ncbi:hypothetical protein L218DRAFT_946617 [Marasmius fiardii PR-910]|nr:hypothetical protein L218DRAFT_946617 [Marasmius fiardii PR-910]